MPKPTTKASKVNPAVRPPILLDTHIAIWLSAGNPRLKPAAISLLESGFYQGNLCLSSISAWEVGLLVSRNRLDLGQSPLVWFEDFVRRFSINVLDVTADIAINSSFVPGKFHGDPADRILIATALSHSTALLTADKNIVAYGKQGFVHIISC